MRKCYLAGPINGLGDDPAKAWREVAKGVLREERCLDPMRRDYRGQEKTSFEDIIRLDLDDINMSHVVLANCWQPSYGTAMEIRYAKAELKIPVIAVVPDIAAASPWLMYHAHLFDRLDHALMVTGYLLDSGV